MMRALLLLLLLLLAAPATAQDLPLAFPVDCTLGQTCYIQNYVDRDTDPGLRDFACGGLSYDGPKGTDIALPTRAAMAEGVTVLAAVPGTVRGVRDEMPDAIYDPSNPGEVAGRECGNGVVISHGDGWETQYCHMALGSILVEPGQTVAIGTPLGQIGLSGATQFPHLHFEVRRSGATVDPFDADDTALCGPEDDSPLWTAPPDYVPGGLLTAGFAPNVPDYDALKAGADVSTGIGPGAPLVLWVFAFGGQAGDVLEFLLTGPQGEVLSEAVTLERAQAQFFRAVGKRNPDGGWAPGDYAGTITLMRDGERIDARAVTVTLD